MLEIEPCSHCGSSKTRTRMSKDPKVIIECAECSGTIDLNIELPDTLLPAKISGGIYYAREIGRISSLLADIYLQKGDTLLFSEEIATAYTHAYVADDDLCMSRIFKMSSIYHHVRGDPLRTLLWAWCSVLLQETPETKSHFGKADTNFNKLLETLALESEYVELYELHKGVQFLVSGECAQAICSLEKALRIWDFKDSDAETLTKKLLKISKRINDSEILDKKIVNLLVKDIELLPGLW